MTSLLLALQFLTIIPLRLKLCRKKTYYIYNIFHMIVFSSLYCSRQTFLFFGFTVYSHYCSGGITHHNYGGMHDGFLIL